MAPVFSKFNFNYSQRNIPIASPTQHKLQLLHSVDKTVRSMDWKAYFALNPDKKVSTNNHGKTVKCHCKDIFYISISFSGSQGRGLEFTSKTETEEVAVTDEKTGKLVAMN